MFGVDFTIARAGQADKEHLPRTRPLSASAHSFLRPTLRPLLTSGRRSWPKCRPVRSLLVFAELRHRGRNSGGRPLAGVWSANGRHTNMAKAIQSARVSADGHHFWPSAGAVFENVPSATNTKGGRPAGRTSQSNDDDQDDDSVALAKGQRRPTPTTAVERESPSSLKQQSHDLDCVSSRWGRRSLRTRPAQARATGARVQRAN